MRETNYNKLRGHHERQFVDRPCFWSTQILQCTTQPGRDMCAFGGKAGTDVRSNQVQRAFVQSINLPGFFRILRTLTLRWTSILLYKGSGRCHRTKIARNGDGTSLVLRPCRLPRVAVSPLVFGEPSSVAARGSVEIGTSFSDFLVLEVQA